MVYDFKNDRYSENVAHDWLKSEGQRIDALRGYKCLGFMTEEDIDDLIVEIIEKVNDLDDPYGYTSLYYRRQLNDKNSSNM